MLVVGLADCRILDPDLFQEARCHNHYRLLMLEVPQATTLGREISANEVEDAVMSDGFVNSKVALLVRNGYKIPGFETKMTHDVLDREDAVDLVLKNYQWRVTMRRYNEGFKVIYFSNGYKISRAQSEEMRWFSGWEQQKS